jgi:hypothetical protein
MPIGKSMPGEAKAYGIFNEDKRRLILSVTNTPYLKKPSRPRLFTILMESHIFLRVLFSIFITTKKSTSVEYEIIIRYKGSKQA